MTIQIDDEHAVTVFRKQAMQSGPGPGSQPMCTPKSVPPRNLVPSAHDAICRGCELMSSTNSRERKQKARLLCVDDDPRSLALCAGVLGAAGYSVVAANDPLQALALATKTDFDLVILDYDMPGMNGAELAQRLRQNKCDRPIILFSGQPSLPAEAVNAVDEYAVKGESVERFLEILSTRVGSVAHVPRRHGNSE
jgi:CheY-like chemotaxis protein